jgi:hypothetical protein
VKTPFKTVTSSSFCGTYVLAVYVAIHDRPHALLHTVAAHDVTDLGIGTELGAVGIARALHRGDRSKVPTGTLDHVDAVMELEVSALGANRDALPVESISDLHREVVPTDRAGGTALW